MLAVLAADLRQRILPQLLTVPVVLAPLPAFRIRAADLAAHHQLTDPAADHPRLAPDPAALVAGRAEDPAADLWYLKVNHIFYRQSFST